MPRRKNNNEDLILRGAAILKAQMKFDSLLGASPLSLQQYNDETELFSSDEFMENEPPQRSSQLQTTTKTTTRNNSNHSLWTDVRSFGEYLDDEASFDFGAGESYGEELEYCGDVVELDEQSIHNKPHNERSYTKSRYNSYTFADGRHPSVVGTCRGSTTTSSSSTSTRRDDPVILSSKELGRLAHELRGLGGTTPTFRQQRQTTTRRTANDHDHRDAPSRRSSQHRKYQEILNDPAYGHAAGFLWQSLMGQHMKVPELWWNGRRGPFLGSVEDQRPWMYVSRDTVMHPILSQIVRGRASAGRILLHIVVQDVFTGGTLQDIAIGCFHPNAKGVRETELAEAQLEDCRDVWVAVRKHADGVSAVESSLLLNLDQPKSRSPLGPGRRISNANVRAVFGERPPLETLRMPEDQIHERVEFRMTRDSLPPSMAILQEFVFA